MFCIFAVGNELGDVCHPDIGCITNHTECKNGRCQCVSPLVELGGICGKTSYLNVDYFLIAQ